MAIRVGTRQAKAHLSEYLDRAAKDGERIVVERDGEPVAALVSIDDLRRLEALDAPTSEEDSLEAREARFRRSMEEAGLITRWAAGPPVPPSERHPIKFEGPPLSEQLIADRR